VALVDEGEVINIGANATVGNLFTCKSDLLDFGFYALTSSLSLAFYSQSELLRVEQKWQAVYFRDGNVRLFDTARPEGLFIPYGRNGYYDYIKSNFSAGIGLAQPDEEGAAQQIQISTGGVFDTFVYDPSITISLLYDPDASSRQGGAPLATADLDKSGALSSTAAAAVASSVAVVVVAVAAALGGWKYYQYKQRLDNPSALRQADREDAELIASAAPASLISTSKLSEMKSGGRSLDADAASIIASNREKFASVNVIAPEALRLISQLGKGSYGAVYLAFYAGNFVAVKQVEVRQKGELENFLNEAAIMSSLKSHRHVCSIFGISIDTSRKIYSLVVEYLPNGSLDSQLSSLQTDRNNAFEYPIFKIVYGTALGLQFLASSGVIHRDVAARVRARRISIQTQMKTYLLRSTTL
jgi:hypothetical protein